MPLTEKKMEDTHKLFLEHNVFIVWRPKYNLGIRIIDEHHRGIVSIINSLHFGMQNNYVKDVLGPIIDMMHDYTHIHFKIEEDFLKKVDYPNAKKHHEFHTELIIQLNKISRNSIMGKDSYQVLEFLKKWWINHICHDDLLFRDYLFKINKK